MYNTRSEKLKSALCIILLSILLKLLHCLFQSAGAEIYLLKMIADITGTITGTVFSEATGSEYVSDNGLFIISSACSGWRLFLLYFLYGHLYYFILTSGSAMCPAGFLKKTCFIYLFSFWINILRIVFFIQFHFLLISGANYLFSHALISMLIAVCGYVMLIIIISKKGEPQYEHSKQLIFQ
ncbi:MAG: hypothetical protein JW822_14045 [Spirochaetales bacterium]|nr:hypothetical protein [Spirochaetales bacterium]